ncbi:hypothetical protein FACS1894130_00120 [Spirochaetia bacterium]|nr:hypothetical protein FACS1894130_00120 [Spirochaetia bacterium]
MLTPAEALRALALELSREDMQGRRLNLNYQKEVLRTQEASLSWCAARDYALETIGKKELLEYHALLCAGRSKKNGEPLSATTINDRFKAVTAIFSLLYREEVLRENPAQNLKAELPERKGLKRRPLTREEIDRFLERLDTTSPVGLRDRTLFELIYSSGLRVSEAAQLKVQDIDFENREMRVRGKFNKDRIVPVSKVAKAFLALYLGPRQDRGEDWVFPGFRASPAADHIRSDSISERFRELLRRFDMDRKEIGKRGQRPPCPGTFGASEY